jgi:hypothetical protein
VEEAAMYTEDRSTELQDMLEVTQHAARKVAAMQQVVNAAKRKLQGEVELSTSLKVLLLTSAL